MRRPHLTRRVLRGLAVLADVPPMYRIGRQHTDARRAIEWIARMTQHKEVDRANNHRKTKGNEKAKPFAQAPPRVAG